MCKRGCHGDVTGAKWEPPSCHENSCSEINKPPLGHKSFPAMCHVSSLLWILSESPVSIFIYFFKATVHSCGILKHCERTPPLLSLSLSLSLLCLHPPSLLPPTGRPNLNEAQQLKRLIIQINIWTHPFSLSHSNIHITVAKRGGIRRDCQCANPDGFSFLFSPPTNWPPDKI